MRSPKDNHVQSEGCKNQYKCYEWFCQSTSIQTGVQL